MALPSIKQLDAEREKAFPGAAKIITAYAGKDLASLSHSQRVAYAKASALYPIGGDHRWLQHPLLSRCFEFTYNHPKLKLKTRTTGAPEELHGIGAAAQGIYYTRDIEDLPPVVVGFVLFFHDILENNRGKITARELFDCLWTEEALAAILPLRTRNPDLQVATLLLYREDAEALLNRLTDTEGLSYEERMKEQKTLANEDESGFTAIGRLCDKLDSGLQDYYHLFKGGYVLKDGKIVKGTLPFQTKPWKFYRYIESRIDLVQGIHLPALKQTHTGQVIEEIKRTYMALAKTCLEHVNKDETLKAFYQTPKPPGGKKLRYDPRNGLYVPASSLS